MTRNPFSPSWGVDPPVVVGRDELLANVTQAIEDGPGSPDRAMLVTGVRGVGKTVFLRHASDIAVEHGWLVVDLDTNAMMLDHFLSKLVERASAFGAVDKKALASISVAGFGLGLGSAEAPMSVAWDVRMERAIKVLREAGVGLLLTIDEVSPLSPELDTLTQAWKRVRGRRDSDLMIIMAGVPDAVGTLVNPPLGSVTSFLDKSMQHTVELLTPEQARDALRIPIAETGKQIDQEALDFAVAVAKGHPFTIQWFGWNMWKAASDGLITLEHAMAAAEEIPEVRTSFHYMMRDRSASERAYLRALAERGDRAKSGDVARDIGKSTASASSIRDRLLDAQLIIAPEHGWVEIAVPGLRDFLLSRG